MYSMSSLSALLSREPRMFLELLLGGGGPCPELPENISTSCSHHSPLEDVTQTNSRELGRWPFWLFSGQMSCQMWQLGLCLQVIYPKNTKLHLWFIPIAHMEEGNDVPDKRCEGVKARVISIMHRVFFLFESLRPFSERLHYMHSW